MAKVFAYQNDAAEGAILVPSEHSDLGESLAEMFASLSNLSRIYENVLHKKLYGNWQTVISDGRLLMRVIPWGAKVQLRLFSDDASVCEMVAMNEGYLMLKLMHVTKFLGNDATKVEVKLCTTLASFEVVVLGELLD